MEAELQPQERRQDWSGALLSVLLHGAALLAALWYVAHYARLPDSAARILPVELVLGGAMVQGDTTPAAHLQIARPHPQTTAPQPEGTSPKGTREPLDELSAQLRGLAQLKAPDTALPHADNSAPGAGGGGDGGEGNVALKDFIRAQILRRWLPDLAIPGARNLPVQVRLRLLRNGVIDDVAILDQSRFHTDSAFRNMALSARDAALLASPIALPPGRYPAVTMVTIDLDPKSVLR